MPAAATAPRTLTAALWAGFCREGAVVLPDPRMPTEPPGRGGQGVCYRAGLLLLNHFPYLQPVITFYLRKIA